MEKQETFEFGEDSTSCDIARNRRGRCVSSRTVARYAPGVASACHRRCSTARHPWATTDGPSPPHITGRIVDGYSPKACASNHQLTPACLAL
jgi:hypothetical protein